MTEPEPTYNHDWRCNCGALLGKIGQYRELGGVRYPVLLTFTPVEVDGRGVVRVTCLTPGCKGRVWMPRDTNNRVMEA